MLQAAKRLVVDDVVAHQTVYIRATLHFVYRWFSERRSPACLLFLRVAEAPLRESPFRSADRRLRVSLVQCESNDQTLMAFQRLIIVEALTLASSHPSWVEVQELYAEEIRKSHVFMLTHEYAPYRTATPSTRKKRKQSAAVR